MAYLYHIWSKSQRPAKHFCVLYKQLRKRLCRLGEGRNPARKGIQDPEGDLLKERLKTILNDRTVSVVKLFMACKTDRDETAKNPLVPCQWLAERRIFLVQAETLIFFLWMIEAPRWLSESFHGREAKFNPGIHHWSGCTSDTSRRNPSGCGPECRGLRRPDPHRSRRTACSSPWNRRIPGR